MKRYTKKTINFYDEIAEDYVNSDAAVVLEDKLDKFLKSLEGEKILDIACGPGHDTDYLTKKGLDCIGIDLSKRMIEIAKENFEGKFEVMDIFNLDFQAETFNGIWCSSIFVHVQKEDLSNIIGDIKKLLKKGGILGVITVAEQKIKKQENDTRTYTMFKKKELEDYLKNANFEILLSETFPYGKKKRLFLIAKKV